LKDFNPRINWYIEQQNASGNARIKTGTFVELSDINYTSSDPYILYWSSSHFNLEGTFHFAWESTYTTVLETQGRKK
jgi:hypothetical protein